MATRILGTLLVAAAVTLGACGDSTAPDTLNAGTYTLRTVNGAALPFVIAQSTDEKLELTSGSVTIASAGRFTLMLAVRYTAAGNVTDDLLACDGSFQQSGNTVTFTETETEECGGSYTASKGGASTFTIAFAPGVSATFRRD